MKPKFEIDSKTPISVIKRKLELARRMGQIYVIARIVEVLRQRGHLYEHLSKNEQGKLLSALHNARYGKKPLADWLPRGYQIARFLMLAMDLLPERLVRVTKRDRRSIRLAGYCYLQTGDKWSIRQFHSLVRTTKVIGISDPWICKKSGK